MVPNDGDSQEGLAEEVVEFLVESNENLDRLDQDLLALELDPHDHDRLSSIFRTIHTIKGTCGFLGFSKLEAVAHVGENLLSKLREGTLVLDSTLTDALLTMLDAVRELVGCIEATGGDGEGDYGELIALLSSLALGEASRHAPDANVALSSNVEIFVTAKGRQENTPLTQFAPMESAGVVIEVAQESDPSFPLEPEDLVSVDKLVPRELRSSVSESSVRVDVALLDRLMDLVGELVLARNQILQYTETETSAALLSTAQRLNLITSELQESVMKTRMQPIGNVLTKLPRVVRDLAKSCEKQVRLELEGQETELDRTIIEAIKDPLTHLLRNGVDHAIEPPAVRSKGGKPLEGVLRISAYHEGGYVIIEIRDDGAGIDPQKIRNKAVEKGIYSAETVAKLGDRDVINLIFAPGFSTAEAITNVSGRGVGMDVVRTNIEQIGGTIEVSSQVGIGTSFRIRIPLTLAIVPALVVSCDSQRYAIPQAALLELLRIEGEQIATDISHLDGVPVYRLRGNLLPLVSLAEVLGVRHVQAAFEAEALNIVVIQTENVPFGLVVDGVVDTQEIVVKPLGRQVKGVSTFSGATIMGDGRVALIVDVSGVARLGRVLRDGREHNDGVSLFSQVDDSKDRQTLLLVQVGEAGRVAVALGSIDRLEEFRPSSVEWAGSQPVVQYRGNIMPLLWLSSALGVGSQENLGSVLPVVVHSRGSKSVGIVVESILDIAEEVVNLDVSSSRLGVLGSAVILGCVTEVVDLSVIVEDFLSETVGVGV